jgi:Phage integrase, N-terminal SAM-like domain/Arm DNA-binding domain
VRTGRVFRRCCSCGRTVSERHCRACGSGCFTWTFVVDVAARGCPRQQKKKGGFTTKAEALAAMNRLQLELADGTYVGLTYLTTGEYLTAWAEVVAGDGSIRPTTAKNYDVAVRVHIVRTLGAVPLQQLTRRMIQGLYQVLRETGRARGLPGGLSPKSVYNVHLTLHRALEDAVADGLLRYNPAARAHRCTAPATRMRVWSSTELRTFLTSVEDEHWFALWRLAQPCGNHRDAPRRAPRAVLARRRPRPGAREHPPAAPGQWANDAVRPAKDRGRASLNRPRPDHGRGAPPTQVPTLCDLEPQPSTAAWGCRTGLLPRRRVRPAPRRSFP